jgi:hypothetical protein
MWKTRSLALRRDAAKVLDLADAQTLEALGVKTQDLTAHWQTARRPTKTQTLGLAMNQQQGTGGLGRWGKFVLLPQLQLQLKLQP